MLDTNEPRVSSVPSGRPRPVQDAVDDLLIQSMRTWLMSSSMNDRMHRGHSEPCRASNDFDDDLGEDEISISDAGGPNGISVEVVDARWSKREPEARQVAACLHRTSRQDASFVPSSGSSSFNGLRGKRACAKGLRGSHSDAPTTRPATGKLSSYSIIKREACLSPALACTGITTAGGTP
jgi:hypothetical protein